VIVRISGEGVYELDDGHHARLNEIDDAAVTAVDAGDEDGFHEHYEELLQFVRTNGIEVPDDDLRPSDVILPPADLSFVEAGQEFTGDGLVPEPA
jgi:hypothetical protein